MSTVPSAAGAVVIGGGAVGCSTAYHLAKAGVKDVVLVERAKLTSGTTWHSAAQVRTLRANAALTQLISYGVGLYQSLEAETGQATGWMNTGSMTIAADADRMVALHRMAGLAKAFGVEAQLMSPSEAGKLWPEMRTDDLHGAVLLPGDGRVNPSDLCAAYVKGFKANGGRVFEGTPVTGVRSTNGRVSHVETANGTIETSVAINCAGLWSGQVAQMAGSGAPVHACEHFYVITKPFGVPRDRPTLGYPDGYLYMRAENGGMLVGCFEPRGKALPLSSLPANFEFGLLPEDWDHFAPMLENAIHRIPALENAQIRTFLNGPESFTFDDQFLIGETPEVKGLYIGAGMNSVGIASSGGIGRALAELVTEGRSWIDLTRADIRRSEHFQHNARLLRDRVPETLGLHYAVPYPGREFSTVRNLKRSPVHDNLVALNARFGQRAGWERPLWYAKHASDPTPSLTFDKPAWLGQAAAEHMAARTGVALFDQSPLTKLMVQGADAERLLQRVCSADMDMAPGNARYTLMLDEQARIASDPVIIRLEQDAYLLVTGAVQATRDKEWLRRHMVPGEFVVVSDATAGSAVFGVMGPQSRALLASLTDSDLSNEAFPYLAARHIYVGYAPVLAVRISYVGELGWELHVSTEWAQTVFETLMEAGRAFGLRPAGMHAQSSLRIEKGNRSWGHDIGLDDTPAQAGLQFAVSKRKQEFVGSKALRQAPNWIDRRMLHFTLDDPAAFPLGDEPILRDGKIVGTLTSAGFGHSVGRAVGLGYVKAGNDDLTTTAIAASEFQLMISGKVHAVKASTRPPYDPSGARMRV